MIMLQQPFSIYYEKEKPLHNNRLWFTIKGRNYERENIIL